MSERTIAALYVQTGGCYYGVDGIDPWDEARDARRYAGPHPVVAHPPCERWGRYWGGVLEHPEASHAWSQFGLNKPPRSGGWVTADFEGGWTCCVEQGAYGHKARKATWLYAFGVALPSLKWGQAPGEFLKMGDGFHSAEEREAAKANGSFANRTRKDLPTSMRAATPEPFRDLLISIARTAKVAGS